MKKIDAIIQPFKLDEVKETLQGIGIEGMTCCIAVCMSQYDLIRDHGGSRPRQVERPQGALSNQEYTVDLLPKLNLEVVVPTARSEQVVSVLTAAARTGKLATVRSSSTTSRKRFASAMTTLARPLFETTTQVDYLNEVEIGS